MTASSDLPCQALVELVTAYLEGALPAAERARFEAHLAGCSGCRTYLEHMRLTITTLGKLRQAAISPPVQGELLRLFRDWKQR